MRTSSFLMQRHALLLLLGLAGCQRQEPSNHPDPSIGNAAPPENPYIFVQDAQHYGGTMTPSVSDPVFCIRIPTEVITEPAPAPHQYCPARYQVPPALAHTSQDGTYPFGVPNTDGWNTMHPPACCYSPNVQSSLPG